jgi:tRNA-binding EMAP/Myf-like protein
VSVAPFEFSPQEPAAASFGIAALDIRVGTILKVWPHPEANNLYCEEIDVGEDTPRQIASGLRPFHENAEDVHDKSVIFL